MNNETKAYVVGLLESYQKREKQIELLHYELAHPANISEDEMIGALALAHGEGGGHSDGHISDKTLYIAMNYRQQTQNANKNTRAEIANRLVELENQQSRLRYYVSLLNDRQAELIKLLYFEGYPQEKCAQNLSITTRTVRRIKDDAIQELTDLYCFTNGFASNICLKSTQQVSG